MKQFFALLICVSLVFLGQPSGVFASQEIYTSPIFVSPVIPLNQEVVQLKNIVLNQDRQNRDQEVEDRDLAEQNAELTQEIVDLQNQLVQQSQNFRDNDLYSRLQNLQQLKGALENYGRRLDERNRNLIVRNEEVSVLRARVDKLEHLFDPVIALTQDVEATKSPSAMALASSLQDQKEFLVFKSKSLTEKYQQLLDFKAQLANTKEELRNLQRKYEEAFEQGSFPPEASLWEGISENLKYQKMRLEKSESSLWQKDQHIVDLEDQIIKKDAQIARLKSELVFAHREISRMRQDVVNLRQAYATDDSAFERIRANIMVLKQKLAAAQAQEYTTNGLSDKDNELIKLKGDIAVLKYQLENDRQDLADDETQIKQQQDAIDHLTVQWEQEKRQSAELSSMLDVYQQKMDGMGTSFKEEVGALQDDLGTAQRNLAQREKDLKKVKDYFFELEKRLAVKNTELKNRDEQLAMLKSVGEKQVDDLAALQERLIVAEAKLKAPVDESELQNTKEMLKRSTEERATLKDSLQEKDGQIEELTKEIANDKKTEKEFEIAKEKIVSLMEDLYFKDKEITRLKMLAAQKEHANKEKIVTLTAQLREGQDRAYKHQKQEIEKLRRDLKAAHEQIGRLMASGT